MGRASRRAVAVALAAPLLCLPLLLPPELRLARFFLAVWVLFLALKLWDLASAGARPPLRQQLLFLLHPLSLVRGRLDDEPGPGRRGNLLRAARGAVEMASGLLLVWLVWREAPGRLGFLAEHAARILAVYPALDGFAVLLEALWRLAGGRCPDVYRDPLLARTPADFWRRYNRPMGQFLREHVFRPAGGARTAARAILAAFFVNAIFHEYLFGVAIGRVQGYQTAYFMLHALGVAATARVKPRGAAAVAWTLATLAFNLATLLVFCQSLDQVIAWYSRR